MALTVTGHAIMRYQERVANVTEQAAIAALSTRAVQIASAIGAPYVKLDPVHRIAVANNHVITVLPHDTNIGRFMEIRASRAKS